MLLITALSAIIKIITGIVCPIGALILLARIAKLLQEIRDKQNF